MSPLHNLSKVTRREYRFWVSTYRDLQIYSLFLTVLSYTNKTGYCCKPGETKVGEPMENGKKKSQPSSDPEKEILNMPFHITQ